MSSGISVQTPLAQQTVSKWIFFKIFYSQGRSCSHREAEVDISMCPGFGLEQRLSQSRTQQGWKNPVGAVGSWDVPAGGEGPFRKR